MERKLFTVNDFSGGEQSSLSEERIQANAAVVAKNGLIDIDKTFYKRNLASLIDAVGTSTARVVNHCEFNTSAGVKYHIVAYTDGRVYYYKEGTAIAFTEITGFASDFGDTADIDMISYADLVWMIDGKYAYTWDGTTLTRVDSAGAGALWAADFDDAKYIEQQHGLIYMAGYTADPAAVMFSRYTDDAGLYINPTDTDAWVATNIFKIPQEGQIITALFAYNNSLLIFTKDKVWELTGDVASTNSVLRELYSYAGCYDHKSIAEVR
ncbi:MAG: hypothetical protein PHE51_10305, partial [Eubacteriales bacterium]|nr:hypothetical protein [Eubacteriales bacterium]